MQDTTTPTKTIVDDAKATILEELDEMKKMSFSAVGAGGTGIVENAPPQRSSGDTVSAGDIGGVVDSKQIMADTADVRAACNMEEGGEHPEASVEKEFHRMMEGTNGIMPLPSTQQQQLRQPAWSQAGAYAVAGSNGDIPPPRNHRGNPGTPTPGPPQARPSEEVNPDGTLVSARLVSEHEQVVHEGLVEEGEEQRGDRQSKATDDLRAYLISALLVVLVSGITLALGFGLTHSSEDNNEPSSSNQTTQATYGPSTVPTATITTVSPSWILDSLPPSTVGSIQTDPASAQAKAYNWILDDPSIILENDDDTSNNRDTQSFRAHQRFALATIFYSTAGPSWKLRDNWLNHTLDECTEWFFRQQIDDLYAVSNNLGDINQGTPRINLTSSCDDEGHFRILSLTENTLQGSIPPEVALLSHLEVFDFSQNEGLEGSSIPTEIGLLTQMVRITMDRNNHQGLVPTELGLLTRLDSLFFGYNPLLRGPVPTELGLLASSLKLLDLPNNKGLTGTLPTELYQLTNLQEFKVQGCEGLSSGELEGMEAMTDLRAYIAYSVPFQGALPSAIGLMTKLTVLNLWNTGITGSLPDELWTLSDMRRMDLDDNFITGTFPAELGQFPKLQELWMNGNQFSGTLPSTIWKNLTVLKDLRMNNNLMQGGIPSEVGQSSSIAKIWFSNLNLSGTIPSELGLIETLEEIFFHDTNIEGTVPTEFATLPNLSLLTISNTSITGSIPDEVCGSLKNMELFCSVILGIEEDICTDVKTHDFSCDGAQVCGCSCEPCVTTNV